MGDPVYNLLVAFYWAEPGDILVPRNTPRQTGLTLYEDGP